MGLSSIIEASIGMFGRWQLMVFLCVFLVNMPLAMQELSITMIAPPVEFKCSDPAIDKCSADCPSRVYDRSEFTNTIVMEWDLICKDEWMENFSQTLLMAGVFVGNFCFGFFADRYGRRLPLVVAVILEIITGFGIPFVTRFWQFCVLRFLVAVAAGGTLCTGFVLVVEIIGRKYRSTFGILFQMTYYIGHASLGLIGYLIREWKYIQLTISIPVMFLVCYYWIVPESPRWLLSVGRLEQAITVMEKAARFNKLPTEHIRNTVMSKLENVEHPRQTIIDLIRLPTTRKITVSVWFNWLVVGLSFFGVAQYIGKIGGNLFINVSLAGLIQIPGNVFLIYSINIWGRKISIFITYGLCSLALFIIIAVPSDPEWPTTLLGCTAMMGVSLAFAATFVWSGELFPTPVRNVGIGSSATMAKIGSMMAPFIVYTKRYYYWIPLVIYGCAPLLAILVCLPLPETLNAAMPDSLSEADLSIKKRAEVRRHLVSRLGGTSTPSAT